MDAHRKAHHTIVVTGAAGGIGFAITRRLLRDGWHVVATDIDQNALDAAASTVDARSQFHPIQMDVADRSSVAAAASALSTNGQTVAGLVNAAGLLQDVTAFLAMNEHQQRTIWNVNYFGSVICTQVFGEQMAVTGGGSIVNITSINEHRPLPLHAYAPAKAALGALTTLTAGELGRAGIRVNAIAPGFTLTPILKGKIAAGKRDVKTIKAHTALGRLVEPDEIAAVASFLMSDDASAISGASIPVDAGWLATSHWMNFADLQHGSQDTDAGAGQPD
ncbi:SDR family NAD(P)-dependent oxidoreductase [Microvirga makkahensis]|uniref:SDR family oxidoreductase n=1 Tax=Microvirga makkahensis TaxID=1128670 RepID=A0A7X3MSA9_9HYPH|nr:SDR family oxidoreductase [Microvirga makkahensis]MXQ12226.1 SDR family oxidoreductase [Microvirga makkahensis]